MMELWDLLGTAWSRGTCGSLLAPMEHPPPCQAGAGGAAGGGRGITSAKQIKIPAQPGVFINENEPVMGLNFQPLGD